MKGIKKAVCKLNAYIVPQDFSGVKLNQNESPLDIPLDIKKEIFERLRKQSWNRYPPADPSALIEKIAKYTDFPSAGIIVGNGSNELIQTLIYSICNSGNKILVVQPGFSVYERVASIMNIAQVKVPLREDFSFNVDAIIELAKKINLVFLSSPNNPTGTALKVDEIERIARSVDCLVAIDEAYYEFHRESAQSLIHKVKNLIIFRTFSKALHLAGIRLGYLLGRKEMITEVLKARLPFSLGFFQQVAGEVVLERNTFIKKRAERIVAERERLLAELKDIKNIRPFPSCANFILFESKRMSGKELFEALYANGVLVRCFDIPRLKDMLRVTIGTPEENEVFLEKLKQLVERSSS